MRVFRRRFLDFFGRTPLFDGSRWALLKMYNTLRDNEIIQKWDKVNSATAASLRKNGSEGEKSYQQFSRFWGEVYEKFGSILAKLSLNASEIGYPISAKLRLSFALFHPRFLPLFCLISPFSKITI